MPDKAIDVIDEAGARVRLKAMTRPPDLNELDQQIEKLNQENEKSNKKSAFYLHMDCSQRAFAFDQKVC